VKQIDAVVELGFSGLVKYVFLHLPSKFYTTTSITEYGGWDDRQSGIVATSPKKIVGGF
jgi:hypothetical protein